MSKYYSFVRAGFTVAQVEALKSLSATENAYLDGITPGTATASKAVVLDSSKNFTGIASITVGTLFAKSALASQGLLSLSQDNDGGTNAVTQINSTAKAGTRALAISDSHPNVAGSTTAKFLLATKYSVLTAAGSAYAPAASSEAVVNGGTVTFSANTIGTGNTITFMAAVKVGAINATDTCTVRVRLGGVSGTVIASYVMGATTAANDVCVLTGEVVAASFSTPNMTFIGAGVGNAKVAGANAVSSTNIATAFTIDTTASTTLVVSVQFSTNSGTNSATLQLFNVRTLIA